MPTDDPLLIARFRAGDEDAIREIHRAYGGAVRTVARSVVRDPELVSEVVQETFLKAWRASATFDSTRELAPWIYTIARRTGVDVLRRERRPTTGDHEPETDVAVETLSFERTWEIFEVRQALDGLPDDERVIVRLSHLESLTHAEIADHLGIPIGTVKSRSARAHRRLAATLAHLAPNENRNPSQIRTDEEAP